jgi:hypothetical protein
MKRVPTIRNIITEVKPDWVNMVRNSSISGLLFKSGTEFFNKSNPMNSKAKPRINSPYDFLFPLAENNKGVAIAIIGIE